MGAKLTGAARRETLKQVLSRIARAVQRHLAHRVEQAWESEEATRGGARPDDMASGKITGPAAEDATPPRIGAVIFSNRTGLLAMSDEGKALVEEWKRQG